MCILYVLYNNVARRCYLHGHGHKKTHCTYCNITLVTCCNSVIATLLVETDSAIKRAEVRKSGSAEESVVVDQIRSY